MRVLASALLCAALALADGPADRAAIENVIHSLKTAKPVSVLFTADADSDLDRLNSQNRQMADAAKEPWSEVTPPMLLIEAGRFVTADVALVDATNMQLGAMTAKTRVLFVMKKESAGWKIASLRMLPASGLF